MRILITGWFSFYDGEATAGDVGSAYTVSTTLASAGIAHDISWSPMFRKDGVPLSQADPDDYDRLIFVCGPAHGHQVRSLHERFAQCRRVAVGVSVIDPSDPAVLGFHDVIARDGPDTAARRDLAGGAPRRPGVPVVGVTAAPEQPEYEQRSGHAGIHAELCAWLVGKDCARVPLDTRLDSGDWRHCADPGQFDSLIRRMDLVVTTRLHGLVLALRNDVPAIAVDPVIGGAKVSAQAQAQGWPVVVLDQAGTPIPRQRLDRLWDRYMNMNPADRPAAASASTPPLTAELLVSLQR